MIREFFGSDQEAALQKAAAVLGIPVAELKATTLPGIFGSPVKGCKVGILVEFDEARKPQKQETLDESYREVSEPKEKAVRLVDTLFQKIGLVTHTAATTKGEEVILNVQITSGKLDQRRGESRELRSALQFLINRMVSTGTGEEIKFIVDIGGTLEERSAQMREVAQDLSRKVVQLGRPIHLRLMDSQDRRLVHLALVDDATVATSSLGEERFRILSIEPKRA
jgi:spoIIIJ-associated protein